MTSNRLFVLTIFVLTIFSLSACTSNNSRTLGDLSYQAEKEKTIEFEKLDYAQVREEYQEILSLFDNVQLKEQIERRIADVYMLEGGEKQAQVETNNSQYKEAIKSYHEILKRYPGSPDNADVLYQLARAYDMDGHFDDALTILTQLTTVHPDYKNNPEAHFRMGEIYYAKKAYAKARQEYLIVSQSNNKKLLDYAHYMLGWTYYKQSNYIASAKSFAVVLSLTLSDDAESDKRNKQLANDTIESISLALARNGGADIIESIENLNGKSYLPRVYEALGDYFLEKQRYEDSAATFRRFVERYNFSAKAPDLHSKLILTYIKGGFPLQALKEKEAYVEYYGLESQYAKNNNGINAKVKAELKVYYQELASHYHNKAQKVQKLVEKAVNNKTDKTDKASNKLAKMKADMSKHFGSAINYYQKYIKTFPGDTRVPEFTFLIAESYFSLKQYPNAIEGYERVAFLLDQFKEKKYQSKAGYAAIISYQKHIQQVEKKTAEVKDWQSKAVDTMLKFAEKFHQDKRSPSVLTNAAEYLFGLAQYQRALEIANNLIKGNVKLDNQLKKTAYGIAAHSYFKLSQFEMAEKSYFNQRSLAKAKSREYHQISERMASSMYKRSEELVAEEKPLLAASKFLEIKKMAPATKARVGAQYYAATLLLSAKKYSEAIVELVQLKKQFSNHELSKDFPRKLAFAYEKSKRWGVAADEYLALSKNDKDPKIRQDALFISAGMYEKNKNYDTAIKLFKLYARTYEQPFEVRMEARFRLAELYQETNDISKKLFWLRRVIDGHKKAGEQRNDRSRWLAAWANDQYGDYFAKEFRRRKLTSQLDRSIPPKNKALLDASQRYEAASNYGLLEFITSSSYKTARLYQQFASELRAVSPPTGLSDEDVLVYADILAEQAEPFESLAIELHFSNLQRAWDGDFNQWVQKSFVAMKTLSPVRFGREELIVSYGDEIR